MGGLGRGEGAGNTSPSDETPFVASALVGKGADEMKNGETGGDGDVNSGKFKDVS